MPVERRRSGEEDLREASRVIRKGGVVAYPTETFYGLAASAFNEAGCRRIFDMKGRPATRALPCIVSGREQIELLVSELPRAASTLMEAFWPGPLTLVLHARPSVAAAAEDGTVAVRESSHPVARALAELCGPITSTSANRSGGAAVTTADDVETDLGDALDLVLDGGTTPGGPASTIVDTTGSSLELVREGCIPFREVLDAIENDEILT